MTAEDTPAKHNVHLQVNFTCTTTLRAVAPNTISDIQCPQFGQPDAWSAEKMRQEILNRLSVGSSVGLPSNVQDGHSGNNNGNKGKKGNKGQKTRKTAKN